MLALTGAKNFAPRESWISQTAGDVLFLVNAPFDHVIRWSLSLVPVWFVIVESLAYVVVGGGIYAGSVLVIVLTGRWLQGSLGFRMEVELRPRVAYYVLLFHATVTTVLTSVKYLGAGYFTQVPASPATRWADGMLSLVNRPVASLIRSLLEATWLSLTIVESINYTIIGGGCCAVSVIVVSTAFRALRRIQQRRTHRVKGDTQ